VEVFGNIRRWPMFRGQLLCRINFVPVVPRYELRAGRAGPPCRQSLGTDLITADLWLSSEGSAMRQLLNNYIIYNKPYVLHVHSWC